MTPFDIQTFKSFMGQIYLFSFTASSFAFMFKYSPLHYQPKVIFSSGSFRVYFVIQSKMGIRRDGRDFHAHVPGLGECFRTVSLYVWNVHLRNWFKIHNLTEWELFPMPPQCALHMYLICNRQSCQNVSAHFIFFLTILWLRECCINLCKPAVKSTFKLLAPGEKCPSHSIHQFIMSYL